MIATKISVKAPLSLGGDCLVVFCPEKKPSGFLKELDHSLEGALSAQFSSGRFEGKPGQTAMLFSGGSLQVEQVLLVGVGKSKDIKMECLRNAAGSAAKLAEKSKCKQLAFYFPEKDFGKLPGLKGQGKEAVTHALVEGAQLALYHFDQYKTPDEKNPPSRINELTVVVPSKSRKQGVQKAIDQANALASAVFTTRNLQAEPSNKMTPTLLANAACAMAKKHKIKCQVLGKKEMERLKMGSLLGVAQGSEEPPQLIVLEYNGGKKKQAPVVIVGKGITFDTGGISIKPSSGMDEMKFDMSGGAVTIGTLQAVAALKLPVNVVGLVPAAENMPSGSAIKPGDILTASNGKTIEVLNTDAEGRLILADALVYAQRYKPRALIDLATLTGACVVALGHVASAVIGTDPKLISKLKTSGDEVGERLWEMPLYEEFEKAIKSDIADLKNIAGPAIGAGTITAAGFLKAFTGDAPWAHLDIAGTAWTSNERPYVPKGGSGFGVRLLVDYLKSL